LGNINVPRKLRRECIGGGMVVKAPSNAVVLIVSATRDVVICDFHAGDKIDTCYRGGYRDRLGHHRFDDKGSQPHVRYWPKADMAACTAHVRFRV
jgi:hypothetical protein